MKDGGSAFPSKKTDNDDLWMDKGMTLRDYFAAKALEIVPFIAEHLFRNQESWEAKDYASQAYKIADAMLKEREALRAEGQGGRK